MLGKRSTFYLVVYLSAASIHVLVLKLLRCSQQNIRAPLQEQSENNNVGRQRNIVLKMASKIGNRAVFFSPTKQEVMDFLKNVDAPLREKYPERGKQHINGRVKDWWKGNNLGGAADTSRVMNEMIICKWLKERLCKNGGKDCINHVLYFNEGDVCNICFAPFVTIESQTSFKKVTNEGDIHDLKYLGRDVYDAVYVPQTLEHSIDPFLGVRNLYYITKPGGVVIASQPFITRPHMSPFHFFSYTRYGISAIFLLAGFDVEAISCWGNAEYTHYVTDSKVWPKVTEMKSFHTTRSEYTQCTIVGRKPSFEL